MNYCNHSATVKHSVNLDIDKCVQCGGYLVWCGIVYKDHSNDSSNRHWHFYTDLPEAIKLAQSLSEGR